MAIPKLLNRVDSTTSLQSVKYLNLKECDGESSPFGMYHNFFNTARVKICSSTIVLFEININFSIRLVGVAI